MRSPKRRYRHMTPERYPEGPREAWHKVEASVPVNTGASLATLTGPDPKDMARSVAERTKALSSSPGPHRALTAGPHAGPREGADKERGPEYPADEADKGKGGSSHLAFRA